jgi:hypothetical protein
MATGNLRPSSVILPSCSRVTVERASRILDALGVRMRSEFEQPLAPPQGAPRDESHAPR